MTSVLGVAHQKCTRWLVGVFVLKMPKATLYHGTSHVAWGDMPNKLHIYNTFVIFRCENNTLSTSELRLAQRE
jgi:hypothetical protein